MRHSIGFTRLLSPIAGVIIGIAITFFLVSAAALLTTVHANAPATAYAAADVLADDNADLGLAALDQDSLSPVDDTGLLNVEQWVERIKAGTYLPDGIRFRQDVVLRAFLLTWRFHSEMQQVGDRLEAETVGMPRLLPETVATDLIEVMRSPADFELSLTEEDGLIVLSGPIKRYPGNGPTGAVFWIDPDRSVIIRAEVEYEWGTLFVSQEYTTVDGHTLLHSQTARVTPYGASLQVDYRDYQF